MTNGQQYQEALWLANLQEASYSPEIGGMSREEVDEYTSIQNNMDIHPLTCDRSKHGCRTYPPHMIKEWQQSRVKQWIKDQSKAQSANTAKPVRKQLRREYAIVVAVAFGIPIAYMLCVILWKFLPLLFN